MLSFVLLLQVSAVICAHAQVHGCIDLSALTVDRYNPASDLLVLEDRDGDLGIDEVTAPKLDRRFVRHDSLRAPSYSYSTSAYWLRFDLCAGGDDSDDRRNWVLHLEYPLLQDVRCFLFRGGEEVGRWITGSGVPFDTRPLPSRSFLFPLELVDGQPHRVYLRVASEAALVVPLTLRSHSEVFASYTRDYWVLGLYFGLVGVAAIGAIALFGFVRRTLFLYYALYIAMIGFFHLSLTGLSFQFLWPDQPWWGNRAVVFFIFAASLTILVFARSVLEMASSTSWRDRFVKAVMVALSICSIAALVLPFTPAMRGAIAAYALASVTVLLAITDGFGRKVSAAPYLLAAWVFIALGGALLSARSLAILPHTFLTMFGVQIGSALEISVLALAVARHTRTLDEERITAQREALTDALTGLHNRRHLDHLGEELFDEARQEKTSLSVIMLDIDRYKSVNDKYGHGVGDEVLRVFANRILGHSRSGDHINRYGGEEFTVLLPGTPLSKAFRMAENLRGMIAAEPFVLREVGTLHLTMSLGVASLDQDESFAALLRRADKALYRAKEAGRNRVMEG